MFITKITTLLLVTAEGPSVLIYCKAQYLRVKSSYLNKIQNTLSYLFQIYLNRQPNSRKKLLVPCTLDQPNPKCYVCAPKPEVTVVLNTQKMTIKTLEDKVGVICMHVCWRYFCVIWLKIVRLCYGNLANISPGTTAVLYFCGHKVVWSCT